MVASGSWKRTDGTPHDTGVPAAEAASGSVDCAILAFCWEGSMKFPRRQFLYPAAAALLTLLTPFEDVAWSQTTGPIKIIVPVPPGSANDVLSRLLADNISRTQGLAVLVENRPGANSVIGTEAVLRASPDGNTLLINSNPFLINPLVQKLNYHPLTSFEPICNLVRSPTFIVVNKAAPYRTLADLLDAARATPGQLTMASVGPASATQIAFELLKREAKVEMTFVPFPGISPTLNALLGDHITAVFGTYGGEMAAHLKAGTLRALAVASPTRIEAPPDVPTVAEFGYKEYEVNIWSGMVAPPRTPSSTIARLTSWFIAALQMPDVREKLVVQGFYPIGTCGVEFGTLLRKQYDDYERIIREASIKGG
jgi:tripartite-type tricarboxylate transporter receptor subunit TctC